jgi:plastocyanin
MRICGIVLRGSLAAIIMSAGCGSDSSSPLDEAGTPVASATVVAGSTSETFTPPRVDLLRNGVVTWSFGGLTHNVTFTSGSGPGNIGDTANAQVARTFPNAGTFDYRCTIHPGMSGRIVVQ